jgi:hypothetical protein
VRRPQLTLRLPNDVQTPPSLSRPATYEWVQLLPVLFDLERFPHRVSSRQLCGSLLHHRISPSIDSNVKASMHKLHAYITAG